MNILGIESSCDETAAAVVQDGRIVKSILWQPRLMSISSMAALCLKLLHDGMRNQ